MDCNIHQEYLSMFESRCNAHLRLFTFERYKVLGGNPRQWARVSKSHTQCIHPHGMHTLIGPAGVSDRAHSGGWVGKTTNRPPIQMARYAMSCSKSWSLDTAQKNAGFNFLFLTSNGSLNLIFRNSEGFQCSLNLISEIVSGR